MMRIAIDNATLLKLHNLDSRLELCNEQGETLGFFVPRQQQGKEYQQIYQWAKTAISDAEVEKSLQETNDSPLVEMLQKLEAKWPIP